MTESVQWSDEVVADAFRSELRARFETHNAAFRAREAAELDEVLRKYPEKRGTPGYDVRDSGAWEIYQASEIRIDRNAVSIVLPKSWSIGIDVVHMFDHTTMSWSRVMIGATIVDGAARVTLNIMLVATWDDAMNTKWKKDGNDRKQVLVELFEEDVKLLVGVIATHSDKKSIRDRLELSLVAWQ